MQDIENKRIRQLEQKNEWFDCIAFDQTTIIYIIFEKRKYVRQAKIRENVINKTI